MSGFVVAFVVVFVVGLCLVGAWAAVSIYQIRTTRRLRRSVQRRS